MHNISVVRNWFQSDGAGSRRAGILFSLRSGLILLAATANAQENSGPASNRYGYPEPAAQAQAPAPVARVGPPKPVPDIPAAEPETPKKEKLFEKLRPGGSKQESSAAAGSEPTKVDGGEKHRKGLLKRLFSGNDKIEETREPPACPRPEIPRAGEADASQETPGDESDQWNPIHEISADAEKAAEKAVEIPAPEAGTDSFPPRAFGPAGPIETIPPGSADAVSDSAPADLRMPDMTAIEGASVLDLMITPPPEATKRASPTEAPVASPAEAPVASPAEAPALSPPELGPPSPEPKTLDIVSGTHLDAPATVMDEAMENARFVVVAPEQGTDFEGSETGKLRLEKGTVLKKLGGNEVTTQVRRKDYREGVVATADLRPATMKEALSFFRLKY